MGDWQNAFLPQPLRMRQGKRKIIKPTGKAGDIRVEKILEMKQIYKAFPGVVAVDKVDLDLYSGEVLALMGENGAGKSTLIKILSGMYHADSGEIIIDGKSYSGFDTKEAINLGIAVIYQELNYLNDLSIAENIMLGQIPVKGPLKKVDYSKLYASVKDIMEDVGLSHRKPADMVSSLSVAEKQLIEIARAFSHHVKVLVMDEPTSALNDTETKKLFTLIRKIRDKGVGIIYISHRMDELFEIADRIEIMRDGRYVTTKNVKETNTDEVVAHMVGREIKDMYPGRSCSIGNVVFEVKNLQTKFLKNIEFYVKKGEVVGFFGLMGAGRSEMARCIYGAVTPETIQLKMDGKDIENKTPLDSLKHKISYVPAERKTEGVNMAMSVKENITLSDLSGLIRKGRLDLKHEKQIAAQWKEKLSIKTPKLETPAASLSGGNQQKIVIAKALNTSPEFLVLNEPTRGIDVGAKVEIYELINGLCEEGKAVLMISSELPEIMAMSDRIYVMCEGQITGEVKKEDFTQEYLMKLAIGESGR